MNEAIYLFCFAGEKYLPDIAAVEVEGFGAAPGLSMLSQGGVSAVYCFVPIEDFTGEGAEERLHDPEWLGSRAVFHEKVIEEIARRSPVFPVPFGTIYLSAENLGNFLNTHLDKVSRFLDLVADKAEWGVKSYAAPAAKEAFVKQVLGGAKLPDSPGARYLFERRVRETAGEKYREWLAKMRADTERALCGAAADLRRRRLFSENGEGGMEMVANWAFLIVRKREPDFRAAVGELNDLHRENGIYFRLSGPWPPFSFTPSLEMGEPAQ